MNPHQLCLKEEGIYDKVSFKYLNMESLVKFETAATAQIIGKPLLILLLFVSRLLSVKHYYRFDCLSLTPGPSNSGKSQLLYELLKHSSGMFKAPVKKIYFCYSVDQPLYEKMRQEMPDIVFVEGLPSKNVLESWYLNEQGHKLLVMDDLMTEASKSNDVVSIYCKYAHHFNFFCFLVSQNVFNPGKEFRTISLNTHYFILFKNRRDELQIQTLGRQIFPRQLAYFMDSYRKATMEKYGYLLVDLSPHSDPTYKLRTHILPQQLMTVFVPEKEA